VLLQLLVPTALTVLRTAAQQLLDEGLAALGTVPRVLHARVYDLLVDRKRVLGGLSEGQLPANELVGDDAEGPQIHVEAVALAGDDFRSHVVRGPYDGIGPESALNLEFLGRAHIDQREEPIHIHHQILGFEIAVNDAIDMQVFHHEEYLRD
jgi:hypothetical protein